MLAEKNEYDVEREADRLDREHTLERQAAEARIHDTGLGHYEKLAVLQGGIFALSVTFLAGLSSQAATHHVPILHLRFLLTCWIAMPFSILLCVVHNWLSTKSFIALNRAWGWRSKKSLLKHTSSLQNIDAVPIFDALLYSSGVLDVWQDKSVREFLRLHRLVKCLEYAVHVIFIVGLFCLGIFAITNVNVFVP